MRPAALALGVVALACAHPPAPHPQLVSDGRYAMGTVLEIALYARDEAAGREALDALFRVAEEIEALASRYDESSQLSELNRAAGQGPRRVDPLLHDLLRRSREYAELSGGAFDVSVGPLVELWTRAARDNALPSGDELARVRARVGADRLRLLGDSRVELAGEGVTLDLGGIAKGYALDRMLPLLRARGIESALLSFGQSSTWAVGAPPDAAGWRLLARGAAEDLLGVLTLRDRALSVSGSLGSFVEIGGRRFGHVLDPRSGQPLTRRRQALVLAPDATQAEALSKALLVLGEAEGLALVDSQPGCEALLLDAEGARAATPGWDAAVAFEALR